MVQPTLSPTLLVCVLYFVGSHPTNSFTNTSLLFNFCAAHLKPHFLTYLERKNARCSQFEILTYEVHILLFVHYPTAHIITNICSIRVWALLASKHLRFEPQLVYQ